MQATLSVSVRRSLLVALAGLAFALPSTAAQKPKALSAKETARIRAFYEMDQVPKEAMDVVKLVSVLTDAELHGFARRHGSHMLTAIKFSNGKIKEQDKAFADQQFKRLDAMFDKVGREAAAERKEKMNEPWATAVAVLEKDSPEQARAFLLEAYYRDPESLAHILLDLAAGKPPAGPKAFASAMAGFERLVLSSTVGFGEAQKSAFEHIARLSGTGSTKVKTEAIVLLMKAFPGPGQPDLITKYMAKRGMPLPEYYATDRAMATDMTRMFARLINSDAVNLLEALSELKGGAAAIQKGCGVLVTYLDDRANSSEGLNGAETIAKIFSQAAFAAGNVAAKGDQKRADSLGLGLGTALYGAEVAINHWLENESKRTAQGGWIVKQSISAVKKLAGGFAKSDFGDKGKAEFEKTIGPNGKKVDSWLQKLEKHEQKGNAEQAQHMREMIADAIVGGYVAAGGPSATRFSKVVMDGYKAALKNK